MGYIKILKTKSYFSRYQVKYKRRRECKTDYNARKKLILQDKNKYKTPKYRFVVRFSNRDIICQIFSSDITHDICIASAYSHELPRYGVKLGLTNYAAAYCTGLLLARRLNKALKLEYEGNTEDLGGYYEVEENETGARPFSAILDVGLKPTTTGSRLFGCLKGACDGGLDIPHNDRRFPRPKSDAEGKDYEADSEFHRKYIFGGHVSEYMTKLKDDDEEAYKKQFSAYIKLGIEPEDLEDIYENAHKAIREEPNKQRGDLERGRFKVRKKAVGKDVKYVHKKWPCHPIKLTVVQRKRRIKQKLVAMGKVTVSSAPGLGTKTRRRRRLQAEYLERKCNSTVKAKKVKINSSVNRSNNLSKKNLSLRESKKGPSKKMKKSTKKVRKDRKKAIKAKKKEDAIATRKRKRKAQFKLHRGASHAAILKYQALAKKEQQEE